MVLWYKLCRKLSVFLTCSMHSPGIAACSEAEHNLYFEVIGVWEEFYNLTLEWYNT